MGCRRCCYHCCEGCEQCLVSFKECMSPLCTWCCNNIRQIQIPCSICDCRFRCTNPLLIRDPVSPDLLSITENYTYIGDSKVGSNNYHVLHDPITQTMLLERIIDSSERSEAKEIAAQWAPKLKQQFPHIMKLRYLFQRPVDGFFRKQYRTYLFFDYVLDPFQKEYEFRLKTENYFSAQEILSYTLGVLSGIVYLQTQGTSVKDLNSVHLGEDGVIKILDSQQEYPIIIYSKEKSILEQLAIQAIQLATMKDVNAENLNDRKLEAAGVLSVDFMMLLNSILEQQVSQQVAYEQLLGLPETQSLIMGMPIEFGLAYRSLAQVQPPTQNPIKSNVFEEMLKQKNYQIGGKQETAFQKILNEKNYKFGHHKKANQLELYTPQDSFVDVLEKYQQQPLILHIPDQYREPSQIQSTDYKFVRETYPNGCIYEGYKQNNLREGFGKYTHPNGAYYEGQWVKNKMEGQGKFYNNDVLIYEGDWKNDEYHGNGRECNEEPDNLGEVNYRDLTNMDQIWMTYAGQFENDKRHGKGIVELVNGATYQGDFREGLPDGNGKYVFKQEKIIGTWLKGQFQ